jgi:hypothetical protein
MPTQDTEETESFEDSSEDPSVDPTEQARIAQASRMQQALAIAQDLSQASAQREEAIDRCIDALPAGQLGGMLCLEATHWQLFEAITWLDAPQDAAERFAARYLTGPDAPLASVGCLDGVQQVKAARNAIASLALGKSFIGCLAAATAVLSVAKSFNRFSVATYKLIDMAFRGHPDLVPDVHAALCELIKKEPGASMGVCIGILASLHSCPGGEQLDFQLSVKALCPSSETAEGMVISALRHCQSMTTLVEAVHKKSPMSIDAERGMFLETKDTLSALYDAPPPGGHDRDLLAAIFTIMWWTASTLRHMPAAALI